MHIGDDPDHYERDSNSSRSPEASSSSDEDDHDSNSDSGESDSSSWRSIISFVLNSWVQAGLTKSPNNAHLVVRWASFCHLASFYNCWMLMRVGIWLQQFPAFFISYAWSCLWLNSRNCKTYLNSTSVCSTAADMNSNTKKKPLRWVTCPDHLVKMSRKQTGKQQAIQLTITPR